MQDAPLMLSVSGARGIVGQSMTADVARNFAAAFAGHIRSTFAQGSSARIVVGRDGRGSGVELADAVCDGLCTAGFDVIDLGIVATPTVGLMIQQLSAIGGVVLTASHNPIQWNGLKTLNSHGLALPSSQANEVIARFRAGTIERSAMRGVRSKHDDGDKIHVDRVLSNIDIALIRSQSFRVALDSVNGGGSRSGRMLLDALGCDVVHLNGECTGTFAHTPEPIEANLTQLCDAVRGSGKLAVGFAQDPDADRLALVDEYGRFIGEEFTLVLGVMRLLQRHGHGNLATNLSTSRMIDDLATRFPPSRVMRTAVGEANVVAGLKSNDGLVGGEGNGGLIWPKICWVRDSLSAMALVLELLSCERRALSAIIADMPAYAMIKRKMDLASIGGLSAVAPALCKVREWFQQRHDARIDETDGIRIDLTDGWVHLRASNTEPIIRLIAESKVRARAEQLCDECVRAAGISNSA